MPRLRTRGAIPPLPTMFPRRSVQISTGYVFMVWYLVKHGNNFTFPVTLSSYVNYIQLGEYLNLPYDPMASFAAGNWYV
jgi:hypothetical protein